MLSALPWWVSDATAVAGLIVALAAAAAVLIRATRQITNRIVDGVEAVVQRETEPLHAAVHEVRSHVVEIGQIVGYELRPNGGGSVKDRVERIASAVDADDKEDG